MAKSVSIPNGQLIKATAAHRSVQFSENANDAKITITLNLPSTSFTKHNGPIGVPPVGFINLDMVNDISDDVPEVSLTAAGTSDIYLNMKVKINARKVNHPGVSFL